MPRAGVFEDGVMDRIRLRRSLGFHESAYLFVLAALEFSQARPHRTPPHLRPRAGRSLAREAPSRASAGRGVLARMNVLEYWGSPQRVTWAISCFTLVDLELLLSQPNDTREDFVDVFAFGDAFDRDYPWNAAPAA